MVSIAIQDTTTSFITSLHDHQDSRNLSPLFISLVTAPIGGHSAVQFIKSQLHLTFTTLYQIFMRASATPQEEDGNYSVY